MKKMVFKILMFVMIVIAIQVVVAQSFDIRGPTQDDQSIIILDQNVDFADDGFSIILNQTTGAFTIDFELSEDYRYQTNLTTGHDILYYTSVNGILMNSNTEEIYDSDFLIDCNYNNHYLNKNVWYNPNLDYSQVFIQ